MLNRYRLLHPSRYVPLLIAAVAVVVLVPADAPTGDGTDATSASGTMLAVSPGAPLPKAAPDEPPVRLADVSQELPVKKSTAPPPAPAPKLVASLSAPQTEDAALQREMRAAEPSTTAAPDPASTTVDEPLPPVPETEVEDDVEEPRVRLARVGSSALNVRAGPSSGDQKLFVLRPGEPVRIAEMSGNWARIVRANGDEGWAYGRYLSGLHGDAVTDTEVAAATPAAATEPAATAEPPATTKRTERKERAEAPANASSGPKKRTPSSADEGRYARLGSDVAARAAPSSGAARLFVLPAGQRVKIAEIRGRWAHVVTEGGVSGWVRFR